MQVNNDGNSNTLVNDPSVEQSAHSAWGNSPAGGPSLSEMVQETWSQVENPRREPSAAVQGGLFSLATLLFEKGVNRDALGEGALAALGGQSGMDSGFLQFAIKAIGSLMGETSPVDFLKTGLALAQDPAFAVVLEKVMEVAVELGGEIAAAV